MINVIMLHKLMRQCFVVLWTENVDSYRTCFVLRDMPLLKAGDVMTGQVGNSAKPIAFRSSIGCLFQIVR